MVWSNSMKVRKSEIVGSLFIHFVAEYHTILKIFLNLGLSRRSRILRSPVCCCLFVLILEEENELVSSHKPDTPATSNKIMVLPNFVGTPS